jgi:hypothetical protein
VGKSLNENIDHLYAPMKVLLPLMATISRGTKAVQQSIGYLPEHNPVSELVRARIAFNADVYKVANPHRRSDLQLVAAQKS